MKPKNNKKEFKFKCRKLKVYEKWVDALKVTIESTDGVKKNKQGFNKINNFWKSSILTEDSFVESSQTGDIILFK